VQIKNNNASPYRSLLVWLVAGADLFREKSTAGWFVLREMYCWLVADKPNETNRAPAYRVQ
jgi:hypothetical protein